MSDREEGSRVPYPKVCLHQEDSPYASIVRDLKEWALVEQEIEEALELFQSESEAEWEDDE